MGAWRTPFGHLWDDITMFFPLLIFSRFLRCVFLTFGLTRGVPEKVGGTGAAPSGLQVKQHFGFITSGFAPVKPQSVNLHPGDLP